MTEKELLAAHKSYTDNMGYTAGIEMSKEESDYWRSKDGEDYQQPYEVVLKLKLVVAATEFDHAYANARRQFGNQYGKDNVEIVSVRPLNMEDLINDRKGK